MSRFFRKARLLLSACETFSDVRVAATVYSHTDSKLLIGDDYNLRRLTGPDIDPNAEPKGIMKLAGHSLEATKWYGDLPPALASTALLLHHSQELSMEGAGNSWIGSTFGGGKLFTFKNAMFWTWCYGDDSDLFAAVARYAGRGIAESGIDFSDDEREAIELGHYEYLWFALLLNICEGCNWPNPNVEIVDDTFNRFRIHYCHNAMQTTWDALSDLLLIGSAPSPQPFVPNDFQRAILTALDGRALKKQPLANAVCKGEGTLLYRKDGLQELRAAKLVAHKNRLGFYRPDRPPAGV